MWQLCMIEGDGIGHEVVPAAVEILRHALPGVKVHQAHAGWDTFNRTGASLPSETIDMAQACGAVIFGAASSPSYPVPGYTSPIVQLRQKLQTFGNLRPTSYLPIPTSRNGVDLIVVRENTEDVYVGGETVDADGTSSVARKVVTRAATERIARMAYELARRSGRQRVTIVHKANVLPQTDGLFRRVAFEISENYPDIVTDELLIDTAAYWMVKEPSRFDIILTSNQYGDILSDMAAAWGGGLGTAPALNVGEGVAIAEPVHGSAPDIAGRGIANPTAMILSLAMLARFHWLLPDVAERIEQAVRQTLSAGFVTPDINPASTVTTSDYVQHIIQHL